MRRPSPALLISLLALFVALSGTSYAVSKLPKNSVGAKQLKKNAVTSKKVKDRSLLARDFKRGQLPAGAAGAKGETGAKGDTGDKGATGPAGPTAVAFTTAASATAVPTNGTATVLATTPASASGPNPGPLVLTETSSVIVNASVALQNSLAAIVGVSCAVEINSGSGWSSLAGTQADIDVGPARDDTIAFTKGIALAPETFSFRLTCTPTASSAIIASDARVTVIATPL